MKINYTHHNGKLFCQTENGKEVEVREYLRSFLQDGKTKDLSAERLKQFDAAYQQARKYVARSSYQNEKHYLAKLGDFIGVEIVERPQAPELSEEEARVLYAALDETRVELLHEALLDVRAYLSTSRLQYLRPQDISWFNPFARLNTDEPTVFMYEQELKERLQKAHFSTRRFSESSSVYRSSLPKFLDLVAEFAQDKIDPSEMETLTQIAEQASNPEITEFFTQAVLGGVFITRKSSGIFEAADQDLTRFAGVNFCFNFTGKTQELPCATLEGFDTEYCTLATAAEKKEDMSPEEMQAKADECKGVLKEVKPFHLAFDETVHLSFYRSRLGSAFERSERERGLMASIDLALSHPHNIEVLRRAVSASFKDLFLPESVSVVANTYLDFLSRADVDAETKKFYAMIIHQELKAYAERHIDDINAMQFQNPYADPDVHTLFLIQDGLDPVLSQSIKNLLSALGQLSDAKQAELQGKSLSLVLEPKGLDVLLQHAFEEMSVMLDVHAAYSKRVAETLPVGNRAAYLESRERELKTLQEQFGKYRNWQYFRAHLLDEDYIDQVENSFLQMQTAYLSTVRNVYDLYRAGRKVDESSFVDPGTLIDFGSFFSTNLFLKGAPFGLLKKLPLFIPPFIAGRIASDVEYALARDGHKARIPLFIPRSHAVPAEYRPYEKSE